MVTCYELTYNPLYICGIRSDSSKAKRSLEVLPEPFGGKEKARWMLNITQDFHSDYSEAKKKSDGCWIENPQVLRDKNFHRRQRREIARGNLKTVGFKMECPYCAHTEFK